MISIFDLFSIGVGPSSSHTVGPMRAANRFLNALMEKKSLFNCTAIKIEIHGSLAYTGKGHSTDRAILMGLLGELPETVDPDSIDERYNDIVDEKTILLNGTSRMKFNFKKDFIFNKKTLLPYHTNGMHFTAYDEDKKILQDDIYYSIGGGFVVHEKDDLSDNLVDKKLVPYNFSNAKQLFDLCKKNQLTIAQLIYQNEIALRNEEDVRKGILNIANVMRECIKKGCNTEGILPGGLNVKRRAPLLRKRLLAKGKPTSHKEMLALDWLNMFAIAVNEENAACSRVVTAPTNGAAGIIPAIMYYYECFYADVSDNDIIDFLLTASAIATLYKKGASISAAEVGCQGEVGVASSMAAGAFAAVLGGNLMQVENAAEIAMEHSLGLTCDPIGGLVQIPCIERNAIGAVKAINAARLALMETGLDKRVTLDKVIESMKQTGHDMSDMYKETSKGGLAKIRVNVIEC